MSFHASLVALATHDYLTDKQHREQERLRAHDLAYSRDPYLAELDKQLRQTMAELFGSVLQDPTAVPLHELRAQNLALQQERAQRLSALGFTQDQVGDNPHCPLCNDNGWIGNQMCQCFQPFCVQAQRRLMSKQINLDRHNFAAYTEAYYSDQFWPGQGASPLENMRDNHKICQTFAYKFGQTKIKNLIMTGSTGLGKTFLATCIAEAVCSAGFSVIYEVAPTLADLFTAKQFGWKKPDMLEAASEELDRIYQCQLLIIDDFGTEFTTEPVQAALCNLISHRVNHEKSTLLTTNLSMEEIKNRYPPQAFSRIKGAYTALHFFGEDIRSKQKYELTSS